MSIVLLGSLSCPVTAQENQIPDERQLPRLVDQADLLTQEEEGKLLEKLDEVSERQELDVVVVTAEGLGGKTPEAYADDFFDYNGYGFGADHDGILLLVSMEERDWHMSTTGFGITAFTDAGLAYVSEQFLPDLSDGDYADAFMSYAKTCDLFITEAKKGTPFDAGHMPPKGAGYYVILVLAAYGIGMVGALIAAAVKKGSLKTAKLKQEANEYAGHLNLTYSQDQFIRTATTTRTIPHESSSGGGGGGSSVHSGSSGTSHGGSGGKF